MHRNFVCRCLGHQEKKKRKRRRRNFHKLKETLKTMILVASEVEVTDQGLDRGQGHDQVLDQGLGHDQVQGHAPDLVQGQVRGHALGQDQDLVQGQDHDQDLGQGQVLAHHDQGQDLGQGQDRVLDQGHAPGQGQDHVRGPDRGPDLIRGRGQGHHPVHAHDLQRVFGQVVQPEVEGAGVIAGVKVRLRRLTKTRRTSLEVEALVTKVIKPGYASIMDSEVHFEWTVLCSLFILTN